MECPFLKYEDTGLFSWRYWCTVTGQQVGDEYNKTKVEYTCKKDCYSCPIYKQKKGL